MKLRSFVPAGLALALFTSASSAQPTDQLFKALLNDSTGVENFGQSVSASGNLAVIGAHSGGPNGDFPGSAFIFNIATNTELFELARLDPERGDQFGRSAAISGTVAIVGSPFDDDNGNDSGSAYLFDATTGDQLFKLLPDDGSAGDSFGLAVAISGDFAIVAAEGNDDNGSGSGSVYVFDVTTGAQVHKLLAEDAQSGDVFGTSVAIDGAIAVIGAIGDDDRGSSAGAAYVFDVGMGVQLRKLLATDGEAFNFFGKSVAISGVTAVVGAHNDNDRGTASGSAYLFDVNSGTQLFKLLASDGALGDQFGLSVGISGGFALAGSPFDRDNGNGSGSAYLYDVTTGAQIMKLLPNDGAAADSFAESVGISGARAIMGAKGDDDNGSSAGAAYVFGSDAMPCGGDCDGSGTIDFNDLVAMLFEFGNDTQGCDADESGSVDFNDLVAALFLFGPCP